MIYSGKSAIEHLTLESKNLDPSESSHWQWHNENFKFNGNEFENIKGFGEVSTPYRGVRLLVYRLLQSRFRRMGSSYSHFNEIDHLASEITSRQNRAYDLNVLRHALTLSFLKSYSLQSPSNVCVIGDGFASMSTLLLGSGHAKTLIIINLTKVLLVDLWYLKLWMGSDVFESSVELVEDKAGISACLEKTITEDHKSGKWHVIAIQAKDHSLLRDCPIDLVINSVSMQEMNHTDIDSYFDHMRTIANGRELHFYCCNREEKKLPDGTVTKFIEYPWHDKDQIIVDELCPWCEFYCSYIPPFYHKFDGPIRHRLVKFS